MTTIAELERAIETKRRIEAAESADRVLSKAAGIRLTLYFSPDVPAGESRTEWPPQCVSIEVEAESKNFDAVRDAYKAELAAEIDQLTKG